MKRLWPISGYDHRVLVRVVRKKTETFRSAPDDPSPFLKQTVNGCETVLDFGGAFGTDYYRLALPQIRWAVVEQPVYVSAARSFESDRLRFFTTCADAAQWLGRVDLLWSSGALVYVPDAAKTIREWLSIAPRRIALARMAWSEKPIRKMQWSLLSENGPGPLPPDERDGRVYYGRRTLPRQWVVSQLVGYQIESETPDGLLAICNSLEREV